MKPIFSPPDREFFENIATPNDFCGFSATKGKIVVVLVSALPPKSGPSLKPRRGNLRPYFLMNFTLGAPAIAY